MKKTLKIFLLFALISCAILAMAVFASAKTYSGTCGTNVGWTLDTSTGELIISGTGAMSDYSASWYYHLTDIKTVIIESGVTSISDDAFYYCSSLTSVTIPDSVTSIGDWAFGYCSSLTAIEVDENNAYYCDIDGVLFNKNKTTIITYPAGGSTTYVIPDSVTSIGWVAFYNCSSLTSVTIPDSVMSIGALAFSYCSSLTAIEVDENNAYFCDIDGVLFNKDKTTIITYPAGGSTTYVIPDSVTSIGEGAFYNSSSLTSITIPNNVTSIGDFAFSYCSSLTSVTISDSVTSIGYSAFFCSSLTSVTIGNSVTSIGDWAFSCCSSLTSVTIPDSVTSIGGSAFRYCSSLTSVTIPDSVTSIGDDAFRDCYRLTSVTIPDSVTSIGDWAFISCSSLTSVTFLAKDVTIDSTAFDMCSALKTIYLYRNSTADSYFSADEYTKIYLDTYTVTYDVSGGSNAPETQVKGHGVDLTLSAVVPTRAGYIFQGWSTTADGSVEYAAGETYTGDADVTLYAVWKAAVAGNINSDGVIDTKDAVLLAQLIAGWNVEIDEAAADCNGDGKVDTKDAVLLAQFLAGWSVTLG